MYLVVLKGNFTDVHARVPAGQPAPTGTTITFTLDSQTHVVHDFGIFNGEADTTAVGQMTPFSL
jgi:hypothetical protein